MLCFCACEEPTRKYQMITDAAAPDAAPRRTFQRHWAKRTLWLCVRWRRLQAFISTLAGAAEGQY